MTVDKEALFKPRLPEGYVEVEGLGTFRVRGLNRAEAMTIEGMKGAMAIERKVLSFGLLDPAMTEAEVGQWQKASATGEIQPVIEKVLELSGLLEDSAKQAYKDFEADPGSEFRIPAGGAAVDVGGSDEGGTE